MLDKLIALLKTLGVDVEAKKGEIEKAAKELEPPKPPPVKKDGETNPEIEQLRSDLAAATEQIKSLVSLVGTEKTEREKAQKTIADQMKADREKKVTDLIAKHEKAGQIPPAMKDHWKKLLEADYDATAKVIEGLPVDPAAKKAAESTQKKDDKSGDDKSATPIAKGLEGFGNRSILKGIQELSQATN